MRGFPLPDPDATVMLLLVVPRTIPVPQRAGREEIGAPRASPRPVKDEQQLTLSKGLQLIEMRSTSGVDPANDAREDFHYSRGVRSQIRLGVPAALHQRSQR